MSRNASPCLDCGRIAPNENIGFVVWSSVLRFIFESVNSCLKNANDVLSF